MIEFFGNTYNYLELVLHHAQIRKIVSSSFLSAPDNALFFMYQTDIHNNLINFYHRISNFLQLLRRSGDMENQKKKIVLKKLKVYLENNQYFIFQHLQQQEILDRKFIKPFIYNLCCLTLLLNQKHGKFYEIKLDQSIHHPKLKIEEFLIKYANQQEELLYQQFQLIIQRLKFIDSFTNTCELLKQVKDNYAFPLVPILRELYQDKIAEENNLKPKMESLFIFIVEDC